MELWGGRGAQNYRCFKNQSSSVEMKHFRFLILTRNFPNKIQTVGKKGHIPPPLLSVVVAANSFSLFLIKLVWAAPSNSIPLKSLWYIYFQSKMMKFCLFFHLCSHWPLNGKLKKAVFGSASHTYHLLNWNLGTLKNLFSSLWFFSQCFSIQRAHFMDCRRELNESGYYREWGTSFST